ncbi:hypothetical protein Tco_0624042 [Tanacetum coccineum]|uniref:Uncharacterized protein n=1 Tax=Tanacetum coccineum TaxID=301880 RepID=A0ABQ4WCX3_9ASTR
MLRPYFLSLSDMAGHFDVIYYLGTYVSSLDFFYVIHVDLNNWMVNTRTDAELAARRSRAAWDAMLPPNSRARPEQAGLKDEEAAGMQVEQGEELSLGVFTSRSRPCGYDRSEQSNKRHKSEDQYQPATQQSSYRSHGQNNDRQLDLRQGGWCSLGYPLRVILTLFVPRVDVDTQESVVVLLVLASICAGPGHLTAGDLQEEHWGVLRLEVLNHSGDLSNKVLLLFGVLIRVYLGVLLF